MKERPILFSGPMVRAILDGRKTQTRRVVRLNEPICDMKPCGGIGEMRPHPSVYQGPCPCLHPGEPKIENLTNPYGRPGDRLWVREAWRVYNFPYDDAWDFQYRADGKIYSEDAWGSIPGFDEDKYEEWRARLDQQSWLECESSPLIENVSEEEYRFTSDERPMRWRPSIHMPRWASRLTLEVENIRIERLQSISVEDACAEGLDLEGEHEEAFSHWQSLAAAAPPDDLPVSGPLKPEIGTFKTLWDSINGNKHPWESNPWVWVIGFRRVER